jgi:hypothetical protein
MIRGPITRAVGSAIRAAKPEKLDAGTVQLARRYAELMDNAAPLAKYVKHLDGLRAALTELGVDDETREHFDKIAEALSAHSVASDLGPKLLAALIALGMTPTARRAAMGGQNGAPTPGPGDELRKRRATRAERAARPTG